MGFLFKKNKKNDNSNTRKLFIKQIEQVSGIFKKTLENSRGRHIDREKDAEPIERAFMALGKLAELHGVDDEEIKLMIANEKREILDMLEKDYI